MAGRRDVATRRGGSAGEQPRIAPERSLPAGHGDAVMQRWQRVGMMLLSVAGGSVPAAASAQGSAPVMTVGRLHYDGGGDWYANPSSLPNLLEAIRTRTPIRAAPEEKVVTLSGDDLWNVPYIYMTGHGNIHWSNSDLRTLRRYLEQGGFLHVDDNYGMDAS